MPAIISAAASYIRQVAIRISLMKSGYSGVLEDSARRDSIESERKIGLIFICILGGITGTQPAHGSCRNTREYK